MISWAKFTEFWYVFFFFWGVTRRTNHLVSSAHEHFDVKTFKKNESLSQAAARDGAHDRGYLRGCAVCLIKRLWYPLNVPTFILNISKYKSSNFKIYENVTFRALFDTIYDNYVFLGCGSGWYQYENYCYYPVCIL